MLASVAGRPTKNHVLKASAQVVLTTFFCIFARFLTILMKNSNNADNTEGTKPAKNVWKSIIQMVLFVGLGILFIWLSVRSLTKDDVRLIFDAIKMVNNPLGWSMLIVSASFAILADVARAVRSKILLEPLGYNVKLSMAFYSVMVCYMANLALPRLGEILRCTFLQRFENVPFQKTLGTVLTERAVDFLCWLVMLIIAIGMNVDALNSIVIDHANNVTLHDWMEHKGLSMLSNYFIYLFLAAIVVIYLIIRLTRKWWMRVPFFVKVREFFTGIWRGFISIKDLPNPWRYVLWTILLWVFYLMGTYFCFLAFPFLRHVGLGAAYSVLIIGTIAFMITQGGLGSYPLIAAGVVFMYGVPYTQGLAAGWVGWVLQTAIALILGLISLVLASFYKKKRGESIPETAKK